MNTIFEASKYFLFGENHKLVHRKHIIIPLTLLPVSRTIPIVLLLLCGLALEGISQILGNEPTQTRWLSINTPYTQVIFEKGSSNLAFRTANMVNFIAERDSSFIGGPAQKVPIILHGNSVLSAGVPNLAPWRSDWTITAPMNPFMGNVPWIDLLAIHEYRHHQQMQHAKKGWMSTIARMLLGQTGWFVNVLAVQPTWFFEGDATYSETVLSGGGRGRMPMFNMEYRAMRLSGMHYGYEKASRNSRKDFVPNIYRQGYYMTTFARKKFGANVWTNILTDTYLKKGFFYPFTRSVKKYTGMNTPELYQATMEDLDNIWQRQEETLERIEGNLLNQKEKKFFTSYRFPHYTAQGIVAEKSSFQEIRSVVLVDGLKDEKVFKPGNITSDHVNLVHNNGWITWATNTYHPRWGLVDYGVIYLYNLQKGKKKQLTKKSRYYGPAPSSDGQLIVAIDYLKDGRQQLVLLNSSTGNVVKRFGQAAFEQFAYPRFGLADASILVSCTTPAGNTLRRYHVDAGNMSELLASSVDVITRPYESASYIFFSATYTGINNIYAYDKRTKLIYQVTSSRFGAFDPAVNNDESKLVYSDYSAMGYDVRELALNPASWKLYSFDNPSMIQYYQPLDSLEGGNILPLVSKETFATEKYNPIFKGLFKFHTWTPFVSQNEFGLDILSNNIFQNTSATIGARYNFTDNAFVTTGTLSYGALFPIFDVGYNYNIRTDKLIYDDQYISNPYSWDEHNLFAGFRIPLKLSKGTFNTELALSAHYRQHFINERPDEPLPFSDLFGSTDVGLIFRNFQSRGRQQLFSNWEQSLSVDWKRSLQDANGYMLESTGELFFPGLMKTHSLFFNGRYLEENLQDYRFEDRFLMARGYNDRLFENKADTDFDQVYVVSGNYELPILFPDWDLGSIAYFRTISANPFYDYSKGLRNNQDYLMRSAGLDINFEVIVLRLLYSRLTLRGLYRFDQPDPNMNPLYFNVVFEVLDLAF